MNGQVRISLSKIICMVLLILVMIPLVAHYYLSKVTNENSTHHVRPQLDLEEFSALKTSDLKMRIEEMLRIKASVSTELRDLEARRRRLQQVISNYSQSLEELKVEITKQQTELQRLKLSVEQAKVAQREASQRNMPELLAPRRILPSYADELPMPKLEHILNCKLYTCFDFSRCSLTSGFPVYIYNPEEFRIGQPLDHYLKTMLLQTLSYNPHVTNNPVVACMYLVIVGDHVNENELIELPYWNGDGRNHLILNVGHEMLFNVNTGRAMIASVSFTSELYRPNFDLVLPPIFGPPGGDVWVGAPVVVPARRKSLLFFQGEYIANSYHANLESVQIDMTMIQLLKKLQYTATEDRFTFLFNCEGGKPVGLFTEWGLCGSESTRARDLQMATYSLIIAPSNHSLVSTQQMQIRLQESLKHGAVPVILGMQTTLPFQEVIDWKRIAIFLPKARITELHFLLRSIPDADLLTYRRQGRYIWERYLASVQVIVDTTIALVRDRIGIPPLAAEDEPSPSVFNSTFIPLKTDAMSPEAEMEESFGPLEMPYPSLLYQRNFTVGRLQNYLMWNDWADPFKIYPHLPFDPLLPSEAKFNGSELGFRPIAYGAGGSGKEFSESLGGNSPREQFTIVMLTYEREQVLLDSLTRLYGLPYLNKVVVVWNAPKLPSEDLRWPEIGVPIHVVKASRNSLNNRFLPYSAIETEAVLSVDDDAHLRHDEIIFGFRVWREHRERLVGFPGRYHAWDLKYGGWLYNSNYSCELSMVLTGAAFFHKYYAYLYSYSMPQAIRDKVDEYMNCEDIAMNFLVAHMIRKPPVKVTSRWTFRCPGCPVSLSEEDSHFQERHKCINFFTQVYGYTPLLNTQYRADSILFKTRIPHDKQKCFKFI